MKKNTTKKKFQDTIDSNRFLNNVVPNIKINQKSYPLNEFQNPASKKGKPSKKSSSAKHL